MSCFTGPFFQKYYEIILSVVAPTQALSSIFLGTYNRPKRKLKTMLMQTFGGTIKSILVLLEKAHYFSILFKCEAFF